MCGLQPRRALAEGLAAAVGIGQPGQFTLNADELSRLLSDAYQCTTLASSYIDKAAMSLLDSGAETPF